jgi:hypothetical protein
MRPFLLALACVAIAMAPSAFAGVATSFPFSFLIDDCRPTLGVPGGGCSAEMSGTIEADCAETCVFRLAGVVRGVRADGPIATGVSASGLVRHEVPGPDPEFSRGVKTTVCSAAENAAEVSCGYDITVESVMEDWGAGYGRCSFVGIDVASATAPAVLGVGVPIATHSARSGSDPGDSRPPAIGWEFCVEEGQMQVLDYIWWG